MPRAKPDWSSRAETQHGQIEAQTELRDLDSEKVVFINRVSKVVKGGRRFSFSAVVVVGDGNGHVGVGWARRTRCRRRSARASSIARKNLIRVPMNETTIPHPIVRALRRGEGDDEAGIAPAPASSPAAACAP